MCGAFKNRRDMTSKATKAVRGIINHIKIFPDQSLIASQALKNLCICTPFFATLGRFVKVMW